MEYLNKSRYWLLAIGCWLLALGAWAQQKNVLSVPDAKVSIGQAQLPVAIENTDEIIAAQFDITLPSTISAGTEAVLTNRCDGHTAIIRNMSATRYRVMLYSDENRPLLAQQGTVLYIPLIIPQTVAEGSELPLVISNATLTVAGGANVLTETRAGKLIVSTLPDLTVSQLSTLNSQLTITPGERLALSWQVQNVGGEETHGGWSEQILLVNKRGTVTKLIGTVYQQETLAAEAAMSRQADIIVPNLLGIEGEAYLQVKVIPNSDTGESTLAGGNNTVQCNDVFSVAKRLFVEPTPATVAENYGRSIAVKVSRSGDWSGEQTFTLSTSEDNRVTLPAQITIPVGQSGAIVYMNITDNQVLDDSDTVVITAKGNDYTDATATLTIEDNEYPNLTLIASESVIAEGETFQLTVTTSRVSAQPIEVTLTSEDTKRFLFPQTVTIPAGETSATVEVAAIDDEVPSLDLSNAFTASAPKHNKTEVVVLLKDNDLPVLELQLTPTTVSESAGVVAVAGVLRRTTNTNTKITVKLTDDADGGLYFGNRTLVLEKGVAEVHFNFGPVDNAIVDGDRTYTITAAVWLSSCSCGASGESAGYVEAQLQVLDNDGAALNVTSSLSTVKEGSKTTLTVSRNTTDTSKDLTVTINSDYEDGLTYDHTVTIPAGQQSTMVEVTSAANSVQGDSHTVIFTVQAEGYATGTCYLMVTDQTLPDARISDIASNITETKVGQKVKLTIEVVNDGAAELPAEMAVKVYHRGDGNAIGTVFTPEAIAVGASTTVTKTITLPATVGDHSYYAVVNAENSVQELTYNNNTSQDVVIRTIAPFSVTVNTDKAIYQQGEKIIITGQLTGNGTANTDVDLYVINEGARQMQPVKTDAQGAFTYEWQLFALQSGHFTVGACYPGEGLSTEMATFDVFGLRRTSNDFITCETKLGEPYEGTIMIENPGVLSQTITSFEVISKPEACEVILEAPTIIAANGRTQLKYKLTGSAVTEKKDWEIITAKLTTEEGSSLTLTFYYYCAAHNAVLTTNTTSIKTTMTKGATREYLLNVMNTGKGATGKINVQIPNVAWMNLGTQAEMPSLEYGETATISLRFTPTDDMPLNLPYTGQIALNCENGNGATVSYNIEVVSEATGILSVDVVDEYTYYTEDKPHVSGAGVVVRHPVTGAIVAQGLTGDDGIFSVELPEGYYNISVSEGHHNSTSGNILIDPGTTNYQEIFLSYTAITYSWDVVETEVEDEYKIETVAKFETNVPKPVVVVNLPSERPDNGSIIAILVTNKGLINAQNVVMNLDCSDGYELELLNPDPVEILAPQQMYTFYARFKKKPVATSRKRAWGNPNADCISIFAGASYDYMCGNAKNMEEALAQNGWGDCVGDGGGGTTPSRRIVPVPHTGPSWPGGPSGPSGSCSGCTVGPTNNGPGVLERLRQWYCSLPCSKELTQALACEAAGKIIPNWISCPYNVVNNCLSRGKTISGCAKSVLTCTPAGGHTDCWLPYVYCMATRRNNNSRAFKARSSTVNTGEAIANNYLESYTLLEKEKEAFWNVVEEHFGNKEWLDFDNMDLANMLDVVDALGEEHVYTAEDFQSVKPALASDELLAHFVERLNNTFQNDDYEGITNYIHPEVLTNNLNAINESEEEAATSGWRSVAEMYTEAYNAMKEYVSESTSSVCASVSIKISQTMVMTRQAFRGTLTMFNGNEETAMQDVKLNLEVVNQNTGEVATSHEFQINAESLEGFIGELDLGSGWTLAANSTGTATVLFIPTKYAAPTEPVEWAFGGTLSYIDPYTGLEVTRELYPVTLTVKPSPELDLTYFMQRDVYGDDALTLDVVEPMKPAEFALLINNKGYGDATNVRMVTQQPEIIENEKGLYIDFELISSQVNGGDAALSFGQSIANDFGTIPAHSQLYAQWWLTSTLLGHFTDYKVEATHVTSYGNEDLSLLDQVTIHELIHGFDMPAGSLVGGPEIGRAFLVNDIADADDLPDKLYFSNGDIANVAQAVTAQIVRKSNTECELTITPSAAGWNYGSILDPTHGYAELKSITRKSDGQELGNTRFWQTDRTLRDGKDWLYENRLHFVDDFKSGSPVTYVITFDPVPETVLEVKSIGTVPAEGQIAEEPIETLTVDFNKTIDATTFTGDDITFAVQGEKKDANQIGISTEDNKRFTLDMSAMNNTLPNGYYTMTVQTADITDAEGYKGKAGKQISWILFRGGLIMLNTAVWPEKAGNVNYSYEKPAGARRAESNENNESEEGTVKYGSIITFTANPDEGYQFLNWTLNGEVVSTDPTYIVTALSDMNVVANFSSLPIHVEIEESNGGHVEGLGTGIYERHSDLTLTAVPDEDYVLKAWLINGEPADKTGKTITLQADAPMRIKAVFEQEYYHQTMTLARGWNWVSSFISEAWPVDYMKSYTNRIVGQFDELISDPQFGLVGGLEQLTAGVAYKVEALERFTTSFRGHLLTASVTLKKGWNWVAYPWTDSRPVNSTITNAEEGDYLVSQRGFTEYADGYWEGSLRTLMPGEGYLYKSTGNKTLGYNFESTAGSRSMNNISSPYTHKANFYREMMYDYPSTMNITARLYREGMELTDDSYLIYAMSGDEIRGVGEYVGSNYYVTVYGDQPVDISFMVKNGTTGETFLANEHLTFCDDVVGSRQSPFSINIGETTGILEIENEKMRIDNYVYDLQGRRVNSQFPNLNSQSRKGVYIVNGRKVVNGKYVNK